MCEHKNECPLFQLLKDKTFIPYSEQFGSMWQGLTKFLKSKGISVKGLDGETLPHITKEIIYESDEQITYRILITDVKKRS